MRARPSPPRDASSSDPDRPPLPAGDAVAWGVLLAGTCLEGLTWPGFGTYGWDSLVRGRANDNAKETGA